MNQPEQTQPRSEPDILAGFPSDDEIFKELNTHSQEMAERAAYVFGVRDVIKRIYYKTCESEETVLSVLSETQPVVDLLIDACEGEDGKTSTLVMMRLALATALRLSHTLVEQFEAQFEDGGEVV